MKQISINNSNTRDIEDTLKNCMCPNAFKVRLKLHFFLLFIPFTLQANIVKFPLYRIGVKFDKPGTYYLLTPENVNKIKKDLFSIVDVCEGSKKSFEKTFSNPNFQVILNERNYNEIITFTKFPHFTVSKEISGTLKERLINQCYSFKNASIEYLGDNSGTTSMGKFISYLYKVSTPQFSYFSEGFFIEARNATILVTANTIVKTSNLSLINSIENINSEEYDNFLDGYYRLVQNKDFRNAFIKLSEAIKLEPKNEMAYEKRVTLNIKLKNYNAVLNDANIILNIDETNINALIFKGLANYFLGNYNDAIDCFDKAQLVLSIAILSNIQNEYFTSFSEIYRLKGEIYISLTNSGKAIENLETALELTNDSLNTASIYYNMGLVKSTLQNNQSEAIRFYTLAINNYSSDALKEKSEAFYNRGINYRKLKKNKEAISDYTSAIKIRPNYVKAYNNRAVAKMSIQDFKGAIADCNQVIKIDNGLSENSGMAYFNRGLAKISLDDISGCDDLLKAKSLGQSISQEMLNICK